MQLKNFYATTPRRKEKFALGRLALQMAGVGQGAKSALFPCNSASLQRYVRKLFIFGKIVGAKERKERIDNNLDCLFSLRSFVVFCGLLRPIRLWLRLAALCICVKSVLYCSGLDQGLALRAGRPAKGELHPVVPDK
jgi:hypothetical protein